MFLQAPPTPKPEPLLDEKYGSAAQIMALPPAKLIGILQDAQASVYAKAKACQRLAVVGDRTAVPALAALLTDPQLSHYARFALEPIPDPAVDAALLAALGKVKGPILIGVINSLGQRKSSKALDDLGRLLHDSDPAVAQAANAALARIRPPL
jgi:HEAT repeat protein